MKSTIISLFKKKVREQTRQVYIEELVRVEKKRQELIQELAELKRRGDVLEAWLETYPREKV